VFSLFSTPFLPGQGNSTKINGKYRTYPPESMKKGHAMIKYKSIPVEKEARMFSVLAHTLRDRIYGAVDPDNCVTGQNTPFHTHRKRSLLVMWKL
jgi:hypothetical protein